MSATDIMSVKQQEIDTRGPMEIVGGATGRIGGKIGGAIMGTKGGIPGIIIGEEIGGVAGQKIGSGVGKAMDMQHQQDVRELNEYLDDAKKSGLNDWQAAKYATDRVYGDDY